MDSVKKEVGSGTSQEQIHGLLFGDKLSWQSIIYDLINTEQLDVWDVDIVLLTNKFLEKLAGLDEADLFVSSKVLFAASLLVRIKSEILLNRDIPELDDILFGKKEQKKYVQERIELDEDVPELILRTPLPRHRKVTLQELMAALGKAVKTENRRIERVVTARQRDIETAISIPKAAFNLKDKIKGVHRTLRGILFGKTHKVSFSEVAEKNSGDLIGTFVPLLHMDNSHKVLLEQQDHLDEIFIWDKQEHERIHRDELDRLAAESEEVSARELEEIERLEAIAKVKNGEDSD